LGEAGKVAERIGSWKTSAAEHGIEGLVETQPVRMGETFKRLVPAMTAIIKAITVWARGMAFGESRVRSIVSVNLEATPSRRTMLFQFPF
jgi:hypothetical protein